MPHYYFSLKTASRVYRDREGSELRDLDAARAQAEAVARDVIRNDGRRALSWSVEVSDAEHRACFEVLFASVADELGCLPDFVRDSLTYNATRVATVNDEIKSVWHNLAALKATLARADGLPYLAAVDGKRVDMAGGGGKRFVSAAS